MTDLNQPASLAFIERNAPTMTKLLREAPEVTIKEIIKSYHSPQLNGEYSHIIYRLFDLCREFIDERFKKFSSKTTDENLKENVEHEVQLYLNYLIDIQPYVSLDTQQFAQYVKKDLPALSSSLLKLSRETIASFIQRILHPQDPFVRTSSPLKEYGELMSACRHYAHNNWKDDGYTTLDDYIDGRAIEYLKNFSSMRTQ